MRIIKGDHVCKVCGQITEMIPVHAREGLVIKDEYPGFYWECQGDLANQEKCESTMFVKKERVAND